MMTNETPWPRRVIAASDTVALLMGYCFLVREKPGYAFVAVGAACVSVLCRMLCRLVDDQQHKHPHGATR